jgi:hypothetical protein
MIAVKSTPISVFCKFPKLKKLVGVLINQSLHANKLAVITIEHCHLAMIPLPVRIIKHASGQSLFRLIFSL